MTALLYALTDDYHRCGSDFGGVMGDKEGKKRSRKGLFALIATIAGAVFFAKKRKRAEGDSGWEDAKPEGS